MKRTKQGYMERLKRAAYWRLAPDEARTVLDDYEEILSHSVYPESDLSKEIGTPRQAARLMTNPRHYRRWLAVFAVLAACVFLPAISPTAPASCLWEMFTGRGRSVLLLVLFLPGLFLSFFWFQRTGVRGESRALPKGLLPLLFFQLIGLLAAWAVLFLLLLRTDEITYVAEHMEDGALFYLPYWGQMLGLFLECVGFGGAISGVFALIRARLTDRRWRACYALGLTVVVLCVVILRVLTSMNFPFDWQGACLRGSFFVTVAGLAGTGASLC